MHQLRCGGGLGVTRGRLDLEGMHAVQEGAGGVGAIGVLIRLSGAP